MERPIRAEAPLETARGSPGWWSLAYIQVVVGFDSHPAHIMPV
jgi:hypothetical protein